MLRILPMSVTGILCDVIGEFTIAIGGLAIGEWLIMIDEFSCAGCCTYSGHHLDWSEFMTNFN